GRAAERTAARVGADGQGYRVGGARHSVVGVVRDAHGDRRRDDLVHLGVRGLHGEEQFRGGAGGNRDRGASRQGKVDRVRHSEGLRSGGLEGGLEGVRAAVAGNEGVV